jgi:Dioxygenases related to 2-nitropropane dioxygenase
VGQLSNFNKIKSLLPIDLPIIQAGMVWTSGAKLAAACANENILGLIGAGSMRPDLLKSQIIKAKTLTKYADRLGVNIPLLYQYSEEQINIALECGIKIFFTSAGSPKKYTSKLKDHGATVIHVTSSPELAIKCEVAGVDAVVAEGFEAGGHNGKDELTTMSVPQV